METQITAVSAIYLILIWVMLHVDALYAGPDCVRVDAGYELQCLLLQPGGFHGVPVLSSDNGQQPHQKLALSAKHVLKDDPMPKSHVGIEYL